MTRKKVHDIMLGARTLEQCAQAWLAQAEYLREHPDDDSVIDEGEALWMTEQALLNMTARKHDADMPETPPASAPRQAERVA